MQWAAAPRLAGGAALGLAVVSQPGWLSEARVGQARTKDRALSMDGAVAARRGGLVLVPGHLGIDYALRGALALDLRYDLVEIEDVTFNAARHGGLAADFPSHNLMLRAKLRF